MTCCGKRVTPYRKDYGWNGWEEGFRCKKCRRIRIPVTPLRDNGETYQREVGAIAAKVASEGEWIKPEEIPLWAFICKSQYRPRKRPSAALAAILAAAVLTKP